MTEDSSNQVQRLLDEGRITIHARALRDSEPEVRQVFRSLSELEAEVKARLSKIPAPLLDFWRKQDRGNLELVANLPPHMVPPGRLSSLGAYDRTKNEAVVSVESLALNRPSLEEEVIHLLDHLLGSRGLAEDETLSAGYAISETLKPLAVEIYNLSQDPKAAVSEYGRQNPREYLAAAIRLAWEFQDVSELRHLSAQLYTVIVDKVLNGEFWRHNL